MRICIIVPIECDADVLRVCIDSILNYSETDGVENIEIVGIPVGSNSPHLSSPQHWHGEFELTRLEPVEKWQEAINKGFINARQKETDYVVVLDSDVVVTPGWLQKLLFAFENTIETGIVAPVFADPSQHPVDYSSVEHVPNTCMMISQQAVDKVGEFDSTQGYSTVDFCDRVRSAGYNIITNKHCGLFHYNVTEQDQEPQPDTRKCIFIGIPNLGDIRPELVQALVYWTHLPQYVVKLHLPVCPTGFEDARNKCIKEFLEEDKWEYYFSLDADIIPSLDTLDRLMFADKDVVSAISLSWRQDPSGQWYTAPTTVRYNEIGEYKHFYGEGVEEIDATGWACMLIKRRVLAVIERPVEVQYHKDGLCALDGDYRGCQKMQEHGFKLFADYSLLTSHYKLVNLKDINDMAARITSGQA